MARTKKPVTKTTTTPYSPPTQGADTTLMPARRRKVFTGDFKLKWIKQNPEAAAEVIRNKQHLKNLHPEVQKFLLAVVDKYSKDKNREYHPQFVLSLTSFFQKCP